MNSEEKKAIEKKKGIICYRSEWLERRDEKMSWKMSWFILSSSTLEYYSSCDDLSSLEGSISINSDTNIYILEGNEAYHYRFLIQHQNENLFLATSTDENRLLWMDAVISVKQLNHHQENETTRKEWEIYLLKNNNSQRNFSTTSPSNQSSIFNLNFDLSNNNEQELFVDPPSSPLIKIYLRDWIKKRGSKFKTWKLRWFLLTEESINYYLDDQLHNICGFILLTLNTTIQIINYPKFSLEITTNPRQLFLSFPSHELRVKWISILQLIIQMKRNPSSEVKSRHVLEPYVSCVEDQNGNIQVSKLMTNETLRSSSSSSLSSSLSLSSILSSEWIKKQLATSKGGKRNEITSDSDESNSHEEEDGDDDERDDDDEKEGNHTEDHFRSSSFKPFLHLFRDPSRHLSSSASRKVKATYDSLSFYSLIIALILLFFISNFMLSRFGYFILVLEFFFLSLLLLLFHSHWLGQLVTILLHYLLFHSLTSPHHAPLSIQSLAIHLSFNYLDLTIHHLRWKSPFPSHSQDFLVIETVHLSLTPLNLYSLLIGSSLSLQINSLLIENILISLEYDFDLKEYNFNLLFQNFSTPTTTTPTNTNTNNSNTSSATTPQGATHHQSNTALPTQPLEYPTYDIHSLTINTFHLQLINILTTRSVDLFASHVFFTHEKLQKSSFRSIWVNKDDWASCSSTFQLSLSELLQKILEKLIIQLLISNKRRTIQFLSSAGAHQFILLLSHIMTLFPRSHSHSRSNNQ